MSAPVVSVVLGTYERLRFLKLTLDTVRKELASTPHEIIVVDGGSTDGTIAWLGEQKDVVTIVQHNRGEWMGKPVERKSWGYFMNLTFRAASGKFVCMISDDCLVIPGAIVNGIRTFESKRADGVNLGALAFYWRNWPEMQKYWVGRAAGGKIFVNHGLYLNSALEEVGYIDEDNYHFYHGDADLGLKLWQAGYVAEDAPNSFIEHYSHANTAVRASNFERERADWANYLKKWEGIFFDPKVGDSGSWIERQYDDPADTVRLFGPLHRKRAVIRHTLDRMIKPALAAVGLLATAKTLKNAIRR